MLYKVEVGYANEFTFTDGISAMTYAELSKTKSTEDVEVRIRLVFEEEDINQ